MCGCGCNSPVRGFDSGPVIAPPVAAVSDSPSVQPVSLGYIILGGIVALFLAAYGKG